MTGKKGKKGNKDVNTVGNSDVTGSSDFPFYAYDTDYDEVANFEMVQKHMKSYFDQKLLLMQTEFQGKMDTLYKVIQDKDTVIGNLHEEIGELKKSCDFLSKETSVTNGKVTANDITIQSLS